MNVHILLNDTNPFFKKSAAFCHSRLRPGIQKTFPLIKARMHTLDSGSKPGMTICCKLLRMGCGVKWNLVDYGYSFHIPSR